MNRRFAVRPIIAVATLLLAGTGRTRATNFDDQTPFVAMAEAVAHQDHMDMRRAGMYVT
jgi:hypothetical protein